jgi:hypothetical protein
MLDSVRMTGKPEPASALSQTLMAIGFAGAIAVERRVVGQNVSRRGAWNGSFRGRWEKRY